MSTIPAAADQRLLIRTFGGSSLHFSQQRLNPGRKQAALLCYLALCQDGVSTRDRISGLLWSNSSDSRARGSLRQTLKNLRDLLSAVGFDGLDTQDSHRLRLRPELVTTDIGEAIASVASRHPCASLLEQKYICDTLLQDFEGIDPEYDNWIMLQRHSIRDRLCLQLENALSAPVGAHTRNLAAALHNMDPSNEVAVRGLMRVYARESNYAGALRVYAQLVKLLDDDYGMDPTAETADLAVEIKTAQSVPAGIVADQPEYEARHAEDSAPELLIESFNTRLIPEDKVYVAQGFRHDLVASLARFRDWRVIDQPDLPDRSSHDRHPGIRYTLRAQTYIDQNELQLVFTVTDADSAVVVWSNTYELRMESWLATQKQIVRKLAVSLNIHISANRLEFISRHRELPAALHDRWLLGQYQLAKWNSHSSAVAEKIFRSLSVDAPGFAPAYSSLVQLENVRHLMFPGMRRKSVDDLSTIMLAKKAVQIDAVDSKTHLCLAWSYCLSGRFEEAIRYFDSALELNENDPWIIVSTALGFSFCAEHDRSQKLIAEANALGLMVNPLFASYQVVIKFLTGDYHGAVDMAEYAGDVISNVRGWKTAALGQLDQYKKAQQEADAFLSLNRDRWCADGSDPSDEAITGWFLHCFPIRNRDRWCALRDGLLRAGLTLPQSAEAPH